MRYHHLYSILSTKSLLTRRLTYQYPHQPHVSVLQSKRVSLPYATLLIRLFEKARIDMKAKELIFIPPKILVYSIVFSIIVFMENKKWKTTLTSTSQKANEDDDLAYIDEIEHPKDNDDQLEPREEKVLGHETRAPTTQPQATMDTIL